LNIRSRFTVISILIAIALSLVWPNLGQRTVRVYLQPRLTPVQITKSMGNIVDYLKEHYAGVHKFSIAQTSKEDYKLKVEQDYRLKLQKLDPKRFDKEEIEEAIIVLRKERDEALKEFKAEKYVAIKGNFIQTAFLNELSRLKNVDPQRVEVEKMWVEDNINAKPFNLGLDLQGGMNLVLKGDFEKLMKLLNNQYPKSLIDKLKKKAKEEKTKDKRDEAQNELDRVLDILTLDEKKKKDYMIQAKEIIRSRVDKTGVSEPLLRIQDNDKIEISLPGVANPEGAKKLVKRTASVNYHLAEKPSDTSYSAKANVDFNKFLRLTSEKQKELFIENLIKKINLPDSFIITTYWDKRKNDISNKLYPVSFMVLEAKPALTGKDISPNTYANFDQENNQHIVSFQLTSEGTKKFADVTSKNKGRRLAIVIDDKVRSAPNINEPIVSGRAQISGGFTGQEAKDLALIIKEGSLPVPLEIVSESSIGPSLGKESIDKGVKAIMYGLLVVLVFMVLYYHLAGFISIIALFVNILFMAALLALMNFTITLPGLAGIVLTIGMAVDANVIIYERIREELARGKSMKLATTQGFERATLTILDSNLTTLVAAVILSQFGVGPIKGFAVTLFIGIVTSLFTSLYITKTIFGLLSFKLNMKFVPMGFGRYNKHRKANA